MNEMELYLYIPLSDVVEMHGMIWTSHTMVDWSHLTPENENVFGKECNA